MVGVIAAVVLAAGLIPPYFEIWKRRGRVVGISTVLHARLKLFSNTLLRFHVSDRGLAGCTFLIISSGYYSYLLHVFLARVILIIFKLLRNPSMSWVVPLI